MEMAGEEGFFVVLVLAQLGKNSLVTSAKKLRDVLHHHAKPFQTKRHKFFRAGRDPLQGIKLKPDMLIWRQKMYRRC